MSSPTDDRAAGTVSATAPWPPLPLTEWQDTYATLHMMTQVVGKIRLACAPMVNHWWQVPLYVSARGLTTSAMPHGTRTFQIDFDLIDHILQVRVDDGGERDIALRPRPVAEFYHDVMEALRLLGVPVRIWSRPVEIEDPIPFDQDFQHTSYDADMVHRCWQVLRQADRALAEFRSGFVGKCSPVHFFWGSFDLAVTRFTGRRAPEHPGGIPNLGDWVTREAYSHECSSCGFWPGSGPVPEPAFYAYAYPEPAGYGDYPVRPAEAYYSEEMREYILPYEAVRHARDPRGMLHDFFQSTYEAGAELGDWNRDELEHDNPELGREAPPRAPTFPRQES
ncbi:MAG TPA: DUF5996 family protein [Longimicrobiaceae bacterium]|nr:DUF5996 family protein [Longimicrobiaceae bacterium]